MIQIDKTNFTWKVTDNIETKINNEEFDKPRINIEEYLIRHMSIAITNKCNLNCEYCYKSVKHDGRIYEIPYDIINKFIEKILTININGNRLETVQLIGGEPTLHKDFFKICELIVKNGLDLRISTNGTNTKVLCSPEMKKLYKTGHVEFRISLDETIENSFKIARTGNAEIVSKNINYLIIHGADVSVKSVITKQNVGDLKEILCYLYDLGVRNFSYSSLYNLGGASNKKFYKENYISDLEIYKKLLRICKYNPEYAPMIKATVAFHIMTSTFIKFPPYFFTKFYLYVNYDGNIYSQDQLNYEDFKLGNIYNYINIEKIVASLKKMKLVHELEKESCKRCFAFPFCTKGNYGELYCADKTLAKDFPTCEDLKKFIEYIMCNSDESISFLKMILTS